MYIGVNNQAKKVSNAYIGINGQAKQISKIYVGDPNGKAKLAWQSFKGEIIKDTTGLVFKDYNALVINKPQGENEYIYTIPEDGDYRIEIISPSTQDFMSQLYRYKGMMVNGEIKINENTYSLSGYPSCSFNLKAADSASFSISLTEPVQGYSLGRGSSYGVQYMKLLKGQKIQMLWYLSTGTSPQDSSLYANILNNKDLELKFMGGDSKNEHSFNNCVFSELSPYDTNGIKYNSFDFDYYLNDNVINLQSDGKRFINLEDSLKGFQTDGSGNPNYMIYTQDQYIENADKCNQLGLGAETYASAIGNYSLYLTLNFSSNYDTVQVEIGSSNYLSGNYPGCFRITPASTTSA